MSKRRRFGGPDGVQRVCAFCGHGIPEQRPVYLVGERFGNIVGPYHAGCAEKLVLVHKGKPEMPRPNASQVYGTFPSRREETLPE